VVEVGWRWVRSWSIIGEELRVVLGCEIGDYRLGF
jgi:hypothetical protein